MVRADLLSKVNALGIDNNEFEKILDKAVAGGEIKDDAHYDEWTEKRFLPNIVLISRNQYAEMCVNALKIVSHVAATDYGSSRQRDMGQLWADMIRGYLGEIALVMFLKANWGIEADLGHDKGDISGYLPLDIHKVRFPDNQIRDPKLKISIKATKWNGIWLDIPGGQFNHSDIHILVKVGVGRDHLFAFFKEISVFKDKILKVGEDIGVLSHEESGALFAALPSFKEIPAYICGFVRKDSVYADLPYQGKKGRINYTITGWNGEIQAGDMDKIKQLESIGGKVRFEGIGEFSHDSGYLFNTGNFKWERSEWDKVIDLL